MKRNIEIGFSPCPNDTFIFDALVNKKIDTGDYNFNPVIEDVETLNKRAIQNKLPVSKISYGILPALLDNYVLLKAGSALGRGAGPLLIARERVQNVLDVNTVVAIPGEHTTANLLFSLVYPETKRKVFVRYDEVQQFVLDGKGAGVIIHENRFTYEALGLVRIRDLGEAWEQNTGLPIPLGGIVASRSIGDEAGKISSLIRKSLEYSWQQYPSLSTFITSNASEMSEEVMRKHINLYVNNYSSDLGTDGEEAVREFIRIYTQNNTGSNSPLKIF